MNATAKVITPEADVTRLLVASLKAGYPVCGVVSRCTEERATVQFSIPLLGAREVIVPNQLNLKPGEHVQLQSVPNGTRYQMQVARA